MCPGTGPCISSLDETSQAVIPGHFLLEHFSPFTLLGQEEGGDFVWVVEAVGVRWGLLRDGRRVGGVGVAGAPFEFFTDFWVTVIGLVVGFVIQCVCGVVYKGGDWMGRC